jgi:hypothetical protein
VGAIPKGGSRLFFRPAEAAMLSTVVSASRKTSRACCAKAWRVRRVFGNASPTYKAEPKHKKKAGNCAGRKGFGQFGLPKPLRGLHYPMRQSIIRNDVSSRVMVGARAQRLGRQLCSEHAKDGLSSSRCRRRCARRRPGPAARRIFCKTARRARAGGQGVGQAYEEARPIDGGSAGLVHSNWSHELSRFRCQGTPPNR